MLYRIKIKKFDNCVYNHINAVFDGLGVFKLGLSASCILSLRFVKVFDSVSCFFFARPVTLISFDKKANPRHEQNYFRYPSFHLAADPFPKVDSGFLNIFTANLCRSVSIPATYSMGCVSNIGRFQKEVFLSGLGRVFTFCPCGVI